MKSLVHEMRNHLAVAIANVEAFIDGKLDPEPARLRAVLQALREVDGLIDDIPSGTRAELAVEPRPIDVCSLIGNEVTALEAAARERGIALCIDRCTTPHAQCAEFFGDGRRIGEIVTNVVLNAIRYSAPDGAVSIDCTRIGDALEFIVADDGPGIPQSERASIFEPGYRGAGAAKTTDGSGLGLSLVKRFVEEHGGTISVEGGERGARFRVRLPNAST